jgi:hypothetical protein
LTLIKIDFVVSLLCFRRNDGLENGADTIEIHRQALDDLVNVNSLFTIAVFMGLSFINPGQQSLENRPECHADAGIFKRLVVYEVVCFSLFLLSSLVAKTLKVHLSIHHKSDFQECWGLTTFYRPMMLLLSAWGSILGCIFLTLSMVDVIQIKIGKLSCGSVYTVSAVGSLVSIVALALTIYAPKMMHAIHLSIKLDHHHQAPDSMTPTPELQPQN